MHSALVREMALLKVDALVNRKVGYNFKGVLATTLTDVRQVKTIGSRLMLIPEAKTLNTLPSQVVPRGNTLRTFGSIVRNDEWLSFLLTLGTNNPVSLNIALMEEYSSNQGRAERAVKVASLVSEVEPASKKAPLGVLTISAALTPKVAVQHRVVAPLLSALMLDPTNLEVVNTLLGAATRAEEVLLANVSESIQNRLDALIKGLCE